MSSEFVFTIDLEWWARFLGAVSVVVAGLRLAIQPIANAIKKRQQEKEETQAQIDALTKLTEETQHLQALQVKDQERMSDRLDMLSDMTYQLLSHAATNNNTGGMQTALDKYVKYFINWENTMENKSIILAVVLFAILIEGTVEYIKLSFQKKMCAEIIGAFIFAAIIAVAYKLDFFKAWLGLDPIVPYLGNVLTALVMARGSNYMFDLIGKFTEAEKEVAKLTKEQEENMAVEKPADEINPDTVIHEREGGVG